VKVKDAIAKLLTMDQEAELVIGVEYPSYAPVDLELGDDMYTWIEEYDGEETAFIASDDDLDDDLSERCRPQLTRHRGPYATVIVVAGDVVT